MEIIMLIMLGLLLLSALTIGIGKTINAQKYKIRCASGVQKADYITLGGIEQYIQIRGQDSSNPVMIVLHGGPGGNMAYYSYAWQSALEQAYTMVHWDQRGCGNTYYRNKEAEKPTLDLLLSDLDELVAYLCFAYNQEKIILMGHSWGTFLGGIYAGKHPEKVAAYIAIGQMLDFKQSEQVSAREAIRLASAAGKTQDAQAIGEKLAGIMAYQKFDKPEAIAFMKFRQLKEKYLPPQYGGRMASLRLFSPYMTCSDFKWMLSFDKLIQSNSKLYQGLLSDGRLSMYDYNLHYEAPVIIIAGDCDWTTPYSMAVHYFNTISAPYKELITIQHTGHIPFIAQSKEFAEALLQGLKKIG